MARIKLTCPKCQRTYLESILPISYKKGQVLLRCLECNDYINKKDWKSKED